MGIIRSNAAFYLEARARGVDFSRTLTLGRQRLYLTPADLTALAAQYRPDLRDHLDDLRYGEPADAFLQRFLDVRDLQALDHSAYEGAAITHDLNAPLPAPLHERFDVVIDSGTLEHVFNLPTAIASCMQLVKKGGTLFLSSPANNMCGHGFYQLSPELFFRLFKDVNGFSLARLVLVAHPFPGAELSPRQTWYDVVDPAEIGARAPLMTRTPAFLMMEAVRVEIVPILATPPQQSDYVARWSAEAGAGSRGAGGGIRRAIFRRLPPRLKALATGWYQRSFLCTLRNTRAFRRIPSRP
ncbi:MAG: methyltransferase domain-containing protein [Acidobacteria bacterium]|nr:methyltransferase domain-containing protein [Acidobacteriota bacterium]